MIDFKPEKKLKLWENTWFFRTMSNTIVRFGVAGFLAIFTTLLLFIFMSYLIGNIGKYAETATERFFTLKTVTLEEEDDDKKRRRVQRPLPIPEQPELAAFEELIDETQLPQQTNTGPFIRQVDINNIIQLGNDVALPDNE